MRLTAIRLRALESPRFGGSSASGQALGGCPLPLNRNVRFAEVLSPRWVLEPPNYQRQPLWKQWWEAQFSNRTFLFFGNAWTSAAAFAALLWWSRVFGKWSHSVVTVAGHRLSLLLAPAFREGQMLPFDKHPAPVTSVSTVTGGLNRSTSG